jgi:RHS repeat-associated protein
MVDPEHQPATTDSLRWRYEYDAYGVRNKATDPLGHFASEDLDVVGRRKSSTNGRGKTTFYEFDPDGLVTKVTDPLSRPSSRHYDADRNPDFSIDAKGNRTDVEYDPVGRATRIIRPPSEVGGTRTELHNEYWDDGSLREQRDGAGAPTRYGYDAQGRLRSETDPLGRVTEHGYDAAGNQTTKANPGGRCTPPLMGCTTMAYDAANQLLSISYSDSPAENVTIPAYPEGYDANGLRRKMTDRSGTSTRTYDLANRLTAHKDGADATVGYDWDRKGQLTGITYPGMTVPVTRDFDSAGRLWRITDWLGNPTTFGYDGNGNIETQAVPTSGESSVVDTFGRNDADELTSIRIDKGSSSLASFTYGRDDNGQVEAATTAGLVDTHAYGYTGLNQLENQDGANPKAYAHDPADNLIRTPSGAQQAFDPGNQLCWTNTTANPADSCTSSTPSTATRHGYDNRGNRTSTTPPASAGLPGTSYTYDQANRLQSASGPPPGSPGTHLELGDYDGDGSTDRTVYIDGAWYVHGQATAYFGLPGDIPVAGDYDGDKKTDRAVYRNGAWHLDGGSTVYFGLPGDIPVPADYDGDGDTDRAVYRPAVGGWYVQGQATVYFGLPGDTPVPADYDADKKADRAVYREGAWHVEGEPTVYHGLPGDTPVPGDYDGDGDTDPAIYRDGAWHVSGQATVYHGLPGHTAVPGDYNGDKATDRATYTEGTWYVRGQTTVPFGPPDPTRTTSYTYDGDGLRTAKAAGGSTTTFTWDHAQGLPLLLKDGGDAYVYDPDGRPITKINGATTTRLHHDQLGSTRLLTDRDGAVAGTYTYDPYGNTTGHTGHATTNLRYTGEYTDAETGFSYLRARSYDPSTGQFLTRDPVVADTRSAYAYVEGNPLNATDPSGLRAGAAIARSIVDRGKAKVESVKRTVASGLGRVDAVVNDPMWGCRVYCDGASDVLGLAAVAGYGVCAVTAGAGCAAAAALDVASAAAGGLHAAATCAEGLDAYCARAVAVASGNAISPAASATGLRVASGTRRLEGSQLEGLCKSITGLGFEGINALLDTTERPSDRRPW